MLKKYINFILILAPAVLLLLWVVFLSVQLRKGQEVIVRIKGYDPRSILSGHYIDYVIDWENTDCTQFRNNICPEKDFEKGLYVQYWGKFGRFYIAENRAEDLDRAVRNSDNVAEIIYSYQEGLRPFALRLLINGNDFQADKH